jgi:hypothetical protein
MRYALILRHDGDYTQAVRPDVLKRMLADLDQLHRLDRALAWETWSGPANALIRVSWGERGFPLEEETEDYVDSILLTIDREGAVDGEVRMVAWTLAAHLAARLKWEIFDTVVGRTLMHDEKLRFETSLLDWLRGMGFGMTFNTDRSAGPGTPRVGG